jgi:transcription antitermination factor NusG
MPLSAHEKAASEAQEKKAAKASDSKSTTVGQRIRVTKGVYEGSYGAVLEVTYKNFEEQQKAKSGDPAIARFAKVSSVLVRTRGGRHALISLKPSEYEHVESRDYERGVA